MSREKQITKKAFEAGFDDIGFTSAGSFPDEAGERLSDFLKNGWHGDMDWLEAKAGRRKSPRVLWPEVKSIIMLGQNYAGAGDPLENLAMKSVGNISIYARGGDYHDLVKKRLKVLARWINEEFQTPVKVFVDTAPVMEKPLARLSGLGWQGKHTNLVSRKFGSWIFLGAIFTTLDLKPSEPFLDACGSCRACLDVCPTKAFPAPYQLDARKCISYLTIEHKGPIPKQFRKAIGNRIYGCDDCLAVCPWNKYAKVSRDIDYFAREELKSPELAELLDLDEPGFRTLFSRSPIKRTGRNRFLRNVLVAAGNSGDAALVSKVTVLLQDPSPLVRGAAAWAIQQLSEAKDIEHLKASGLRDPVAAVRAEWTEG
ncbi:MAG: tRNA epoxyqueuosine(34) reductase QueG [Proteobacteria bacterium]|nr:tRNA epoxyqueuosine(34) reductase QueG [Pseudomonadota bacterium]